MSPVLPGARSLRHLLVAVAVAATSAVATPAAAQVVYLAYGDSITAGSFDDPTRAEPGYPPRLEDLLADRGVPAIVENHGWPGETTDEALARLDSVLAGGGDVLLLMEGTNDVGLRVSNETIAFNLAAMADRAERRGFEVVHATVIPRRNSANYDPRNVVTGDLNGMVRELAWAEGRNLADPFEVFLFHSDDPFTTLYVGNGDHLHPNDAGYDVIAETFADVLTGVDSVRPVTGHVSPLDDEQGVAAETEVQIDLYDFGSGLDVTATRLLINEQPVPATITGDERRQTIRYRPSEPFVGVVFVGLEAADRTAPPHRRDGTLLQFVIQGTRFLPGDINRDGRVDGSDLLSMGLAFGSSRGEGRFLNIADLDGNGQIDGNDLAILASNFGKRSF
ncbi:MAG TPA: GDSL-type esterase/lipase family protein [Thermoanaerobaculia bacterium]|nr:GDSL-type esterase/lipase family protein [Thermoanaerobaculia bacterium]